jgi:hypothetical protein
MKSDRLIEDETAPAARKTRRYRPGSRAMAKAVEREGEIFEKHPLPWNDLKEPT